MNKLKKYAGLLNDEAPKDHFLAYITGNERDMLIKSGGKETSTPSGIFAYPPEGQYGSSGTGSYDGGWDMDDTGGADHSSEPTGGTGSTGGNGNKHHPANEFEGVTEHIDSTTHANEFKGVSSELSPYETGKVFEDEEYLEPDKDHWKATQKAIQQGQKPYINEKGEKVDPYKADWNDWSKEQQDTYQKEMNELKGTTDKNYSFYKGNEGTTNLSFSEHWKDVPATNPTAAASPLLRLLIAGGRTLKENFTTDYGTWKYGAKEGTGSGTPFDSGGWFGKIFNKDGSVKTNLTDDQINDAYNQATPDLAPIIGGTAPQESQAAKWYANLGNTGTNQFQFSFANELSAAKAKQASILGNPSAVGWLAVNQSPFYNFLKERKLDKGIL